METDPSDIERIAQINLMAVLHVSQALYPYLIKLDLKKSAHEQKQFIGSSIVNIASVMGELTFPFSGYYPITKAGVIAYSDQLRRELRYQKVRVSCIMPGPV